VDVLREFADEQRRLADRARAGRLTVVDLDPDGTWPPWAAVVVLLPTGVAYAHQCGGVACEERLAEGYLVPVAGPLLDADAGHLDPLALTAPFHPAGACAGGIDPGGVARLTALVAAVAYWSRDAGGAASRAGLVLDQGRQAELAEGWAPVRTPGGPGILLWTNCD
jgi:hypothetical protein